MTFVVESTLEVEVLAARLRVTHVQHFDESVRNRLLFLSVTQNKLEHLAVFHIRENFVIWSILHASFLALGSAKCNPRLFTHGVNA